MKKQTMTMITVVLLLMLVPVFASDDGKTKTIEKDVIFNAPAPPPPFLVTGGVPFDQMIDIKVVTGAPYSAVGNSEAVQTLADGNRIVRRNSTQVARDSQGRTRSEFTFNEPAEDARPVTIISISDPTTGVTYTLHPETKTGEKIPLPDMIGGEASANVVFRGEAGTQAAGRTSEQIFYSRVGPGPDVATAAPLSAPHVVRFKVMTAGGVGVGVDDNANIEQLGKQVIEGVEAEGKRTTITIPAGQIGNEQPIVITNEVWYSPELQTIVYSKRDDPMAGTTIFKLTNIVRDEPDAALFQVPPDYKIDSPEMKMHYFQNKVPKPEKK